MLVAFKPKLGDLHRTLALELVDTRHDIESRHLLHAGGADLEEPIRLERGGEVDFDRHVEGGKKKRRRIIGIGKSMQKVKEEKKDQR